MIANLFWLFVAGIFYTYAGYPLLLALLARIWPKTPPYKPSTPSVTLLIAAYNEEAVIAEKIKNSLELDYPRDRLQILVTADGSSDRTPDIVREYADQGIELIFNPPRRGKMDAINRAMPHASGEIVLMSDANNMYQSNVLRELVAPFADPTVGVVTGGKSIVSGDGPLGESEGLYWKYESFIKEQETRLGCCMAVAGEIIAIRHSLFEPLPEGALTDDTRMAMRIIGQGYRVIYASKARSYERVSASAQDEISRRAKIYGGRYQDLAAVPKILALGRPVVAWQVLSHQTMRTLLPLMMLGALLTNFIAVVWPIRTISPSLGNLGWPFNWVMFSLQLAFYGVAWLGNRKEFGGVIGNLVYLPTFLVNSNLAGLIGLYRLLIGNQSPVWERVQRRGENL